MPRLILAKDLIFMVKDPADLLPALRREGAEEIQVEGAGGAGSVEFDRADGQAALAVGVPVVQDLREPGSRERIRGP